MTDREKTLDEYIVALHELDEIREKVHQLRQELTEVPEKPPVATGATNNAKTGQKSNPFLTWRLGHKLTQAEAGERCKVSGSAFRLWERDEAAPTAENGQGLPRGLRKQVQEYLASLEPVG